MHWRSAENYRENDPLLDIQCLRGLVIGNFMDPVPTTTAILNIIHQSGWLDHYAICIYPWKESSPTRIQGSQKRSHGWYGVRGTTLFNYQEALGDSTTNALPLESIVVHVMERCELTFTMIVRISQIHQHCTLYKSHLLLLDDCLSHQGSKAEIVLHSMEDV